MFVFDILSFITFVYFGAFLLYLIMMVMGRDFFGRLATFIAGLALLAHTAGIALRWVKSYELGIGHAPLSNLYESLIFFAWAIILLYLIVEWRTKNRTLGVLVTPLAFLAMAYSSFTDNTIQPLIPALKSNWLTSHVITCFFGYAAFGLSFGLGFMYLLRWLGKISLFKIKGRLNKERYLVLAIVLSIASVALGAILFFFPEIIKNIFIIKLLIGIIGILVLVPIVVCIQVKRLHDLDRPGIHFLLFFIPLYNIYLESLLFLKSGTEHINEYGPPDKPTPETDIGILKILPSKRILDDLNYQMVVIGFTMLTLGIITGSVWAHSAWGSYWTWDPKETWSLITWLVYAAVIHSRLVRGWKGKKIAILCIVGFVCVLFTYFGVNYLAGLHSYAKS